MPMMTKGEARRLRKAGLLLPGSEPRDDRTDCMVFTETARGYDARARWARRYDALNGAPESEEDR